METIAGFQKTGRNTIGPGSDLVELTSETGFRHQAVVFHPEYRSHPAIGPALEVIKGFLEAPYVTGMLELVAHDPAQGAFVYPTGQAWSIYEVVRTLADLGATAGIRAGLELMYSAGEILIEAAEAGEPNGVYSHGGLTPWRVMLKADGQVEIMGHALPQVEILQFHANQDDIPGEDSFRYCPPERMEARREEVSADLFGLALIAFELMTGKPVYDGLVNDIRTQAARGEGSRRLFRFKDQIPNATRDLLNTALKAAPSDRFKDGRAFLEAVRRVLGSSDAQGPSLIDVMQRVSKTERRTGQGLESSKTQALSKDDLARILAEEDDDSVAPADAGQERVKAWAPPSPGRKVRSARRERQSGDRPAAPPPADPPPRAAPPPRDPPPRAAPPPPRDPAPPPVNERARMPDALTMSQSRRPRRVRQAEPEAPEPPAPAPTPTPTPSPARSSGDSRWGRPDPGRRSRAPRRRAESTSADTPAPVAATPEPPPPPPEPPPPDPRAVASGSADDILASISRSGASLSGRRDRSNRSAADVIDEILSSGSRPAAPPPREPVVAPSTSGDRPRVPIGARRPRRAGPPEEPPAPPEPVRTPPGPIRTPPEPIRTPPEPIRTPPEPIRTPPEPVRTPPEPVRAPPEPRRDPLPQADTAPQPLPERPPPLRDDITEPQPAPEVRRDDPRPEPELPRDADLPEPAPRVVPSAVPPLTVAPGELVVRSAPSAIDLDNPRPPDPLRTNLGGKGLSFRIKRGPGGSSFRFRIPSEATLAEAVSLLTGTMVPLRTDLQGRVTLGYRLGDEDGPAPGAASISEFAEGSTLVLHPVAAREVWMRLEVDDEDTPARMMIPVNTALPVAAVTDHLCAWLRLSGSGWALYQSEEIISPHVLMDELDPDKPLVLRT
ncbi:MAG: hypothetical protein H6739_13505 [Alphaproteobacteria bacterium]|nr:hypothetical protein [Alphaproteobacteria bacterium]